MFEKNAERYTLASSEESFHLNTTTEGVQNLTDPEDGVALGRLSHMHVCVSNIKPCGRNIVLRRAIGLPRYGR